MIINLHGKLETSLQGRENLPINTCPHKVQCTCSAPAPQDPGHHRWINAGARTADLLSSLFFLSLPLQFISLFPFSLSSYPLIQTPLFILGHLGLTHQFPFQVCSLLKTLCKLLQVPSDLHHSIQPQVSTNLGCSLPIKGGAS